MRSKASQRERCIGMWTPRIFRRWSSLNGDDVIELFGSQCIPIFSTRTMDIRILWYTYLFLDIYCRWVRSCDSMHKIMFMEALMLSCVQAHVLEPSMIFTCWVWYRGNFCHWGSKGNWFLTSWFSCVALVFPRTLPFLMFSPPCLLLLPVISLSVAARDLVVLLS